MFLIQETDKYTFITLKKSTNKSLIKIINEAISTMGIILSEQKDIDLKITEMVHILTNSDKGIDEYFNNGTLPIIIEGVNCKFSFLINKFIKRVTKFKNPYNPENIFLQWLISDFKKVEPLISKYEITDNLTICECKIGLIKFKFNINKTLINGSKLTVNYNIPLFYKPKEKYPRFIDCNMLHIGEHIIGEYIHKYIKDRLNLDFMIDARVSINNMSFEVNHSYPPRSKFFNFNDEMGKEINPEMLFHAYFKSLLSGLNYYKEINLEEFEKHLDIVKDEETISDQIGVYLEEAILEQYCIKNDLYPYTSKIFHKNFQNTLDYINDIKNIDPTLKPLLNGMYDLMINIISMISSITLDTSKELTDKEIVDSILNSLFYIEESIKLKNECSNLNELIQSDKYYSEGMTISYKGGLFYDPELKNLIRRKNYKSNEYYLSHKKIDNIVNFKGKSFLVFDFSKIMISNPNVYRYQIHNHQTKLLINFLVFIIVSSFKGSNFTLDVLRHKYKTYCSSYISQSFKDVKNLNQKYSHIQNIYVFDLCNNFEGDLIEDFLNELLNYMNQNKRFDNALDIFKSNIIFSANEYSNDVSDFLYDFELLKNIDKYLTLKTLKDFINRLKKNNCITRIDIK